MGRKPNDAGVESESRDEKEKKMAATKKLAPAILQYNQKLKMRRAVDIIRKKEIPNPLTKTSIELRQEAIELIRKDDARAAVEDADLDGLAREVLARRIHSSTTELKVLMSKINSPKHVLSRAIVYNMLLQILITVGIKEKFKEDELMVTS